MARNGLVRMIAEDRAVGLPEEPAAPAMVKAAGA
jgi:hypothetical protein